MAGLVPAIHDVNTEPAAEVVDTRHEAATPFHAGFFPTLPAGERSSGDGGVGKG
jgi:hypothetical protein